MLKCMSFGCGVVLKVLKYLRKSWKNLCEDLNLKGVEKMC
jgi:hypothetical protein